MRIPPVSGPGPAGQASTEAQAVAVRPPTQQPRPAAAAPAETPAAAPALSDAVARAREVVRQVASSLEFSVDGDTGKTVVRVVDASTQELIRQIPSEEMLSIARNMDRIEGLLIKSKA